MFLITAFFTFPCWAWQDHKLFGEWRVTEFKFMPIAAMNKVEAEKWIGKVIVFNHSFAGFPEGHCQAPTYRFENEDTQSYFLGFRMLPGDLKVQTPKVLRAEVTCSGEEWDSPGATFVEIGKDKIAIPWDGVFFILKRQAK